MNTETPNIPERTAEDWEWLARDRQDPDWQLIRDGLAKILPDDLTGYAERGINIIETNRRHVPIRFALDDDHFKILINERDTNLDWLALHLYTSWKRHTSG
jgi:hypothetical protein